MLFIDFCLLLKSCRRLKKCGQCTLRKSFFLQFLPILLYLNSKTKLAFFKFERMLLHLIIVIGLYFIRLK
jgi:hypothetical protein